jgi:hypothetical protein
MLIVGGNIVLSHQSRNMSFNQSQEAVVQASGVAGPRNQDQDIKPSRDFLGRFFNAWF